MIVLYTVPPGVLYCVINKPQGMGAMTLPCVQSKAKYGRKHYISEAYNIFVDNVSDRS